MRETARTTTRPRRRRSLGDGEEREESKGESEKKNRKKKDKRMISQALFKEEKKRKIGGCAQRVSQSLLFRTCPYFFWAIFTARSSMISSLPPGMAKALTSLYSLSTFSPCPPLT